MRIGGQLGRPDLVHLGARPVKEEPPIIIADVRRLEQEVDGVRRSALRADLPRRSIGGVCSSCRGRSFSLFKFSYRQAITVTLREYIKSRLTADQRKRARRAINFVETVCPPLRAVRQAIVKRAWPPLPGKRTWQTAIPPAMLPRLWKARSTTATATFRCRSIPSKLLSTCSSFGELNLPQLSK